ncbi:hypothetical protein L798_10613 [Zootermopsis nevadensis]|uniref:Uncharacterized protein n=1 Tax=Zootermopsis nevadensis TaxID=136037 RepID=A0A067R706_ZOONE|nr:hypothetical protein L798_10613 [Zootermopsis nevadensis]
MEYLERIPVLIGQEASWAQVAVGMQRLEENSSAAVESRTPVFQFIGSHYTD